ncbi:MAG TPA: type VI secretion protein IcmF/TssM N-terminal domain-containing protein [Pyrinomonadaceae bacterium]|nr:type VI secretion protein IcmF/TssM N-terminal domain-containing protein [Pyrinomonadaceae bacterium]
MLSPYWPYILAAVVLLVLGTALFLYLVLRRARNRAVATPAPAPAPAPAAGSPAGFIQQTAVSSIGLKTSFSRAMRLLRSHVTRRDYRYRLPWFLLVGEAQSGKTTLLSNSGLDLPLGSPAEQLHGVRQGVNWFFFDRAVVLDVDGDFVLRQDGETSNNRAWATVSRLLQKHRPERPLDGVILTIPCEDLGDVRGPLLPDQRARIEQRAACLYRKLWQAQKQLGMSFPVYVVVTKCDRVPGFKSFCRELPPRLRDEMFGWSSPYTLETAYRPEWVEEAFQSVYRYLFQAQVEVFADRADVEERDQLFLLPSEMQALRAPLRLYLDQIFKESSFHESFFLRGIYFCGDGGPAFGTAPLAAAALPAAFLSDAPALPPGWDPDAPLAAVPAAMSVEEPVVPAFVRDLLEKKVFLEDMLARPVTKARLSRNRTVLAAQVLSIAIPAVGCLGLLLTYGGVRSRAAELQRFLDAEARDLKEVRELRVRCGAGRRVPDFYRDFYRRPSGYTPAAFDPEEALRQAQVGGADEAAPGGDCDAHATRDNEKNLLAAMARLDARNFYSVFIPSSWFSDINERTGESVVVAFNQIILEGLRLQLDERTNSFLNADPIFDYTGRRLPGDAPEESLLREAAYDGGARVPPRLRDAAPAPPAPAEEPAAAEGTPASPGVAPARAARRQPEPLYDQTFAVGADATLHGFIERFTELRVNRARYENLSRPGSGSLEELEALGVYLNHERLPKDFDANNDLYRLALRDARGADLSAPSPDVQRRVAAKVGDIVEVLYYRSFERAPGAVHYEYVSDVAQTEALLARPEYTWLATQVFDARSPFHDTTISSGLRELRAALEGLSRESFMTAGVAGAAPRPRDLNRRQLVWDAQSLRQALALCNDYARFTGAEAASSKTLDDSVRQAAFAQLKARVTALVARARTYQPTAAAPGAAALRASLAAEVASFRDSQELLAQLLEATDRLGLDAGLRTALSSQVTYLVSAAGRQFEAERFYSTARPNFAWWDGRAPVAAPAYDAASTEELAAYLASERRRIAYLAREVVAPVLTFAAAQNLGPQQLRAAARVDWEEMSAQLQSYDDKQPGNSLASLETFILAGMDRAADDDCAGVLRDPIAATASRDFFAQTRDHLRRLLRGRCRQLAEERAYRDSLATAEENLRSLGVYREIADEFNEKLAGRFPFSSGPAAMPGAPAAPGVDAESLRAFFDDYAKKAQAARASLERNPELGSSGAEAAHFLDQLDRARDFFGFNDKKAAPAFDYNLQFRVNQRMETGWNQIIDWSFDVGRKKFRLTDTELSGRWVYGEPVRLTLRWANNSPTAPFVPPDSDSPKVRDRVAIFEFRDRWALLSLMQRHAAERTDFPDGVDTDVYTLKFRVPTRLAENLPDRQPPELLVEEATVFMRVSLVAAGGKEPLLLPSFPVRAPKF